MMSVAGYPKFLLIGRLTIKSMAYERTVKKNKVTVNDQQERKRIRNQMVRIFYLGELDKSTLRPTGQMNKINTASGHMNIIVGTGKLYTSYQ